MKQFFAHIIGHPIRSIISAILLVVFWRLEVGAFYIPLVIYAMWSRA